MGYSLKVTLDCQGKCGNCYENSIRNKPGFDKSYNIDAILKTLDRITKAEKGKKYKSNCPGLHGGEPTLIKIDDLEAISKKIYDCWGYCGIQTNGINITNKHIEIFKRYKYSVGVSLDGDTWQLNQGRWNVDGIQPSLIQKQTDKVLTNMKRLREGGISLSCITVLRRHNASKKALPEFKRFILRLRDEFDIWSGRTNPVICFDPRFKDEQLLNKELGEAFVSLADFFFSQPGIFWHPYYDIIDMTMGYLDQTCNFRGCDPFYTVAERAINKDGIITNCLKSGMSVDGIQGLACDKYSGERNGLLYQLPQENGGCKDCRYWELCHGNCPGEGIDGDWRNHSRFCEAWKMLFSHTESRLKGMLPNLMTPGDFYPVKPTPALVQKSLRLDQGSTYRRNCRQNLEKLKKELAPKKNIDHADHHTDQHFDKPHKDHMDYNRIKNKTKK